MGRGQNRSLRHDLSLKNKKWAPWIVFGVFAVVICLTIEICSLRKKIAHVKQENVILLERNDSLEVANGQLLSAWMNTVGKIDKEYDAIFFGNSITRNSDFGKYYPNQSILNLGLGGDELLGMAERVHIFKELRYDKVFVMAGINDVGKVSSDEFMGRYAVFMDSLLGYVPKEKVVIQNMLPISESIENGDFCNREIQGLNERIKLLCKEKGLRYQDIWRLYAENGQLPIEITRNSDGLHIVDAAYEKWARELKMEFTEGEAYKVSNSMIKKDWL